MKCLECKSDLVQLEGKREKQFCNSSCRSNYWQKAQRKIKKNNKPQNKKNILAERNTLPNKISSTNNPLTEIECFSDWDRKMALERVKILESEIANPQKGTIIPQRVYIQVREKELADLKSKLNTQTP